MSSFDDDYLNYDHRNSTNQFDGSFTGSVTDSPMFNNSSYGGGDDVFSDPIYVSGGGFGSDKAKFSSFSHELNGGDGDFAGSDGPLLPPPTDMLPDEGFALREWKRQNAIRLTEKEKQEKDLLNQIIDEADEFKVEFYRRRKITSENNINSNREKEKLFLVNQEKFHAEADKNYWKAIAELVPKEVPAIENKRGKKDKEKKPSIVVIQGPKPGKPTDLSRMRQILLKLKHDTPPHLKPSAPPAPTQANDAKTGSPIPPALTPQPQAVAAA